MTGYLVIQDWMQTELKLKGTDTIIFALIYGFSQDGESEFFGSRTYIKKWTNVSFPTLDKSLNYLIERKLIIKRTETINNVIFNSYRANTEYLATYKETLQGGCKETLHNNIPLDNIDNNNIIYIVELLNEKSKSSFKSTTDKTRKLITARLKEGFVLEDFEKVVSFKCKQWLSDKKMSAYLRPETLFGTKFEGYLNEAKRGGENKEEEKRHNELIKAGFYW